MACNHHTVSSKYCPDCGCEISGISIGHEILLHVESQIRLKVGEANRCRMRAKKQPDSEDVWIARAEQNDRLRKKWESWRSWVVSALEEST